MSVEVRRARDGGELEAALALVVAVFGGEQGVWAGPGEPGREVLRLVAVEDGGTVLGSCRVLIEHGGTARLGSLAVAREARGRGYGAALLADAEREARAAGARRMRLNAQLPARGFYARAGYATQGEVFVAEGIDHVAMEKPLADA